MKKTFMSCHLVYRIFSFILLLIAYPFIRILFNDFSVGKLLIAIFVTLLLVFICVMLNIMKIVVYDDKFVVYKLIKKEFKYELIESIELNNMGLIVVNYDGNTYKLRGVLSALDQMPSEKKNQDLIDYINVRRNKEELIYTNTDEVLDEKDMNLF